MRAYREQLPRLTDASWAMLDRRLDDLIPFQWHHHAEFELTLTLNSEGQRFIGDHVSTYGHADLVLVGPNQPHTWASRNKCDESAPHHAMVLWFRKEWLETLISGSIEFQAISELLERATGGLSFNGNIGEALTPQFKQMFTLPPANRLLALLAILNRLAEDKTAQKLARAAPQSGSGTSSRMDRVLAHLHQNYAEPTNLEDLAQIAALSVSGLHRMFLRHTQLTITAYVARLRIGDASARLAATDQPIGFIAQAVGYASLANFNRQFKAHRNATPRDYRRLYHQPAKAQAERTKLAH